MLLEYLGLPSVQWLLYTSGGVAEPNGLLVDFLLFLTGPMENPKLLVERITMKRQRLLSRRMIFRIIIILRKQTGRE
jgi:hypothetical protein